MEARKKRDIVKELSKTRALLSRDGEIHFVLRDEPVNGQCKVFHYQDETEAWTILKREAAKPLLLARAE
jgi:hypothetical protein